MCALFSLFDDSFTFLPAPHAAISLLQICVWSQSNSNFPSTPTQENHVFQAKAWWVHTAVHSTSAWVELSLRWLSFMHSSTLTFSRVWLQINHLTQALIWRPFESLMLFLFLHYLMNDIVSPGNSPCMRKKTFDNKLIFRGFLDLLKSVFSQTSTLKKKCFSFITFEYCCPSVHCRSSLRLVMIAGRCFDGSRVAGKIKGVF